MEYIPYHASFFHQLYISYLKGLLVVNAEDAEVLSNRHRTVSENEIAFAETEQLHHIPDTSMAEESWENLHEVTLPLYQPCREKYM
jgi:hypothetical protein